MNVKDNKSTSVTLKHFSMCLKTKQEFNTYNTGDMLQNNYYNNQPQTQRERH